MKTFLEGLVIMTMLMLTIWAWTYIAIMDIWAGRWLIHALPWPK